jgi:imidazolonepropionase-like amidohydrolase
VLITHANMWTGRDALRTDADVLLIGGKISAVSPSSGVRLTPPSDDPSLITYDATGRWVTPGLFDLHSHAGLGAWFGLQSELGYQRDDGQCSTAEHSVWKASRAMALGD